MVEGKVLIFLVDENVLVWWVVLSFLFAGATLPFSDRLFWPIVAGSVLFYTVLIIVLWAIAELTNGNH